MRDTNLRYRPRQNDALTYSEWKSARRRIVEELGDDVLADKIEDTFAYGIQPGEPTNEDLDVWAAMDVFGWHLSEGRNYWMDDANSWACGIVAWRPSENISQALRIAMETDIDVDVCLNTHHELGRDVKSAFVTVDATLVHEGAFDEGEIARKIMLELWRRLGET